MDIDRFKRECSASNNDIISTLHDRFEQFDKRALSKARNSDKTGLTICPIGTRLLRAKFDRRAKVPIRELPKLQCRLTPEERDAVLARLKEDGYSSMQDGMLHIIKFYMNGGHTDGTEEK